MRGSWLASAMGGLLALSSVGEAVARGSHGSGDPWAAEHVAGLPREMHQDVLGHARACGNAAAARHYFSTSIEVGGSLFRSMHFEDFACADRRAVCNADGCLHEIYLKSNGAFRRVFSTYARDVEMRMADDRLVIEISGGPSAGSLVWNGHRFVAHGRNSK